MPVGKKKRTRNADAPCQVVAVVDRSPLRSRMVGVLRVQAPPAGAGPPCLQLLPNDPRLPACVVDPAALPAAHRDSLMHEAMNDKLSVRSLVVGSIAGLCAFVVCCGCRATYHVVVTGWPCTAVQPSGCVDRVLGNAGDLAAETEALLTATGCRAEDFSPEVWS